MAAVIGVLTILIGKSVYSSSKRVKKSKCTNGGVEMDFEGIKINVPKLAGSVLDAWYSGWPIPKKDQSSDKILMIIPDWDKPKKWYRV